MAFHSSMTCLQAGVALSRFSGLATQPLLPPPPALTSAQGPPGAIIAAHSFSNLARFAVSAASSAANAGALHSKSESTSNKILIFSLVNWLRSIEIQADLLRDSKKAYFNGNVQGKKPLSGLTVLFCAATVFWPRRRGPVRAGSRQDTASRRPARSRATGRAGVVKGDESGEKSGNAAKRDRLPRPGPGTFPVSALRAGNRGGKRVGACFLWFYGDVTPGRLLRYFKPHPRRSGPGMAKD